MSSAWGWLRSWGGAAPPAPQPSSRARGGWSSWGWRRPCDPSDPSDPSDPRDPMAPAEEFWEAQEKLTPAAGELLLAGRPEPQPASGWWRKHLPTSYLWWPRRSGAGGAGGARDADGELSDYGTPPPSPTPSSSPFRVSPGAALAVLPEHYDICFNFLRHLFDLLVVGFLCSVAPPARLALELLGVRGALRLWLHGMALFLVVTVGMAGLLWLAQEYLLQFALLYGAVQALVISVSVRQSAGLAGDREREDEEEEEEAADGAEADEQPACEKDPVASG